MANDLEGVNFSSIRSGTLEERDKWAADQQWFIETVLERIQQTHPNAPHYPLPDGRVRFGHPSGTLSVGAEAREENGQWVVTKAMMSRSARRLMEGWVRVPEH